MSGARLERAIAVTGSRGDAGAGVDDARSGDRARGDRVAQRQRHAAIVAEVAHRREAGVERLARVGERLVGEVGVAVRQRFHQAFLAGVVAFEMHVAVDQAGQDVALAQIDDGRAGKAVGRGEAVADRFDPAVADDHGRSAARLLTGAIQQAAGVDQDDGVGGRLCRGGRSRENEDEECECASRAELGAVHGPGMITTPRNRVEVQGLLCRRRRFS